MSSPPTTDRPPHLVGLYGVLAGTLIVSTMQLYAPTVLAADIIDDLGVSRAQIGWIGAANTAVGAATAPFLGRLADRIGARRSLTFCWLAGAVGLALTAAASVYWALVVASLVAGLPQGMANPATNKLIADRVPLGRRGLVTGIKQSGVPVALFLAGATLPAATRIGGWRSGIWAFAALAFLVALAVPRLVGRPEEAPPGEAENGTKGTKGTTGTNGPAGDLPAPPVVTEVAPGDLDRLPGFVHRVALYSLLLGTATGAVSRFLPLYASEELGYSTTAAGLLVAVLGALGIAGRVLAGQLAENRVGTFPALRAMALLSAVAGVMLLVAPSVGAWLLWPLVLVVAFSMTAWNSVAMLAVLANLPMRMTGRAAGVALLGFLAGMTIGSPLAGWTVDATGSYVAAWTGVVVLSLASAVTVRGRATPD
ncbi:MAG: MFS transporter [Actinomycetota bacterium]|nr:MFS transporter [Actinomycetota bacterium]